jgi:hypothetical protein
MCGCVSVLNSQLVSQNNKMDAYMRALGLESMTSAEICNTHFVKLSTDPRVIIRVVQSAVARPPMHEAQDLLKALSSRTHLVSAYTVEQEGGIRSKERNANKLIQSFWRKPKSLLVEEAPVAYLGPDYSLELIALATFLQDKYIPRVEVPHVLVHASNFGPKQAQVELMFVDAFIGFHIHTAFGTEVKYLLPNSTAPVTFVGYSCFEAQSKLGYEKSVLAMKSSDVAALRGAGVELFTFTQNPGNLVVLDPLCAYMMCFHRKSAAYLTWLLPWITADLLALHVKSFGREKTGLPLLQYDMELQGLLGLEKEVSLRTLPHSLPLSHSLLHSLSPLSHEFSKKSSDKPLGIH